MGSVREAPQSGRRRAVDAPGVTTAERRGPGPSVAQPERRPCFARMVSQRPRVHTPCVRYLGDTLAPFGEGLTARSNIAARCVKPSRQGIFTMATTTKRNTAKAPAAEPAVLTAAEAREMRRNRALRVAVQQQHRECRTEGWQIQQECKALERAVSRAYRKAAEASALEWASSVGSLDFDPDFEV
jgi:hypothetical protein